MTDTKKVSNNLNLPLKNNHENLLENMIPKNQMKKMNSIRKNLMKSKNLQETLHQNIEEVLKKI